MKILLISNNAEIIGTVRDYCEAASDYLKNASSVTDARKFMNNGEFDTLIIDCSSRVTELISFVNDFSEKLTETVVLLIGPLDPEQREKLGHRLSAHYSIDKPLRGGAFDDIMRKVRMRSEIVRKAGLIGRSPAMEETIQTIIQIGATPISILITGESGSGKEVIARAIHSVSSRADKPFLAVNCAALAEGILESELFGHEKGSFTGAAGRRKGMFENANGGTIFLDEIGEIPNSTQLRLLRVLEEREIMRVGGTEIIPVDVRVIAATNRNLAEHVNKGSFRRDLYYRIKVLEIKVPPLRERAVDIPLLIDRMAKSFSTDNNLPLRLFSDETKAYLSKMHWSGNVRELRNFVESSLALTDSPVIKLVDIPHNLIEELVTTSSLPALPERNPDPFERELILYKTLIELKNEIGEIRDILIDDVLPKLDKDPREVKVAQVYNAEETLDKMEQQAIMEALKHSNGNRRKAAQLLGIGQRTLYRKLRQYGIS